MNAAPVTVYFGLGSNMGNRHENLERALAFLAQRMAVEKVSLVYDTEPVGNQDQPHFLNQVCRVTTWLAPAELLALVKAIESKLGRTGGSGEPRPIDIDILLYGDQVIDTPRLVIPHPRLAERAFVLIPLAEIGPDLVHPVSGKTVREMKAAVDGVQGVLPWECE